MDKLDVWKLRSADLRQIAARSQEPERERKILALAEMLEDKEHAPAEKDAPTQH